MNEAYEKAFQIVQALGSKLGVASEHIWEVLVRQGYVRGATSLATLIALVALIRFTWNIHAKIEGVWFTAPNSYGASTPTIKFFAIIPFIIAVLAAYCNFGTLVHQVATGFINPEFMAAEYVLAHVK